MERMDAILGGLNPAQAEAVQTLTGPVLVLAGAGSGKTKVLTHRIANLIAHGVRPDQILAVTFTNKAAKEMRVRLWRLLESQREAALGHADLLSAAHYTIAALADAGSTNHHSGPARGFMPYMGTFHGICMRILRIEYVAAGIDRNFTIYDSDDQLTLVRRVMKGMQVEKGLTPKIAHSMIGHWKTDGATPAQARKEAIYPNQKQAAEIFARYETEKAAAQALDFDDLLLKTAELFAKNPTVRQRWQQKFQHILIDEYQDTNSVQYRLIKYLVNEQRNICVVGDDWQSIYSWRGADFTNILNFERDFPGAKVVKLEQNYRSTGNILAASQKVITQNKTRTDKTLFTEAGQGDPITIEGLADETGEAMYVAREITRMHNSAGSAKAKGIGRKYSDFAVLYRTNAQSYAFEKAFLAARIPYKIIGGVRFYDRREVKDVLAILKLLVNPHDRVSFERVVKNVLSGVGETSMRKMFEFLDQNPAATLADAASVLNARAATSVQRVINFLDRYQSASDDSSLRELLGAAGAELLAGATILTPPAEIVEDCIKYFDFTTLLQGETPEGSERMRNLEVLVSNAVDYLTLDEFLADAALLSSADEATSANSVSLMTLHAAKGLEFPVVFMVGLEEGLFPSSRSDGSTEALEEERRLAYVGMTRAMQDLFLTFASSRFAFGGRSYNTPSQFLLELGYNPYGAGNFGDSGIFAVEASNNGVGSLGILGGDPDGIFGPKASKSNFAGQDDDFGFDTDLRDGFDPFPEDVPVFEG